MMLIIINKTVIGGGEDEVKFIQSHHEMHNSTQASSRRIPLVSTE